VAVALGLALLGAAVAVLRRDLALGALAVAGAIGFAVVTLWAGPWVDLKAFVITGPIVLALAFAGAATLARRRLAALGWALATGLGVLILWGNALVYRQVSLAPYERLRDLERIADDLPDAGPLLYPAYEEHAEFLLRRQGAVSTTNPPRGEYGVTSRASGIRAGQEVVEFDLDEYEPGALRRFELIVVRRSPLRSRPPSDYALVRRTAYHDVWHRRPRPQVLLHLALPAPDGRGPATCRAMARAARERPGARLVFARMPELVAFNPAAAQVSPNWVSDPGAFTVITRGPGRIVGTIHIPRPGRYSLWMAGSATRALEFTLDGRPLGVLENELGYPDQLLRVGERTLRPGAHSIVISRGGGSLRAGTGDAVVPRVIGAIYLQREPRSLAVEPLAGRSAGDVCRDAGARLDWVEVIERGS
jgi:hypothetical protein